jgi:cell division transport system ATP-binding protein
MIQLFHVSKYYDKRPALLDITLQIEKGEFVVLLGPSGAGKTTLLKLISRAETPDDGQILVQNRNIARLRPADVPYLRRTMGMVFQDFRLLPKKSVFENVALPLIVQGATPFEIRRKVTDALKAVGIEQKKDSRPAMLSAGEQQRACIARALVNTPIILLADEPTGNLDETLASEIVELFKAINQRGTTVLIATHNVHVIEQTKGRLVSLQDGRLSQEYEPVG